MFTTQFWQAAFERAVKTFAQALAALLVADGTGVVGTNWGDRLSVAGMAAVVSVLTSLASAGVGGDGPSLANEVVEPPTEPAADTSLGDGLGDAISDVRDRIYREGN